MKNYLLKQVKKEITLFYSEFKSDNILSISEDKNLTPFIHVLSDENHVGCLVVSIAVDYPICEKAVDLVLLLNSIAPVIRAESFFVNNKGEMSWGNDAYIQYELENIELQDLEPVSDKFH